MENCPNCQAQRVVVSGSKLNWQLVTSTVLQGTKLSAVSFNSLINDLDDWTECIVMQFTGDSKMDKG